MSTRCGVSCWSGLIPSGMEWHDTHYCIFCAGVYLFSLYIDFSQHVMLFFCVCVCVPVLMLSCVQSWWRKDAKYLKACWMTCSVPGLLNASFNDGASVHLCRDIFPPYFENKSDLLLLLLQLVNLLEMSWSLLLYTAVCCKTKLIMMVIIDLQGVPFHSQQIPSGHSVSEPLTFNQCLKK